MIIRSRGEHSPADMLKKGIIMKEYKFIQMKYKVMKGGYVTSKEDGYRDHRTVIREMAAQGWRFVGHIPTEAVGNYSAAPEYDLVFEKDE